MAIVLPEGLSAADIEAAVRDRYSQVGADPSQPASFPVGRTFAEAVGYPAALLDALPAAAAEAFAGVACPVPHAALRPGETVVDLGCGAGLDSLCAGRYVGPTGCVVGVDFAPAMIARAEQSFAAAGMPWVEARLADGSALPLADGTADAVVVNGIFNLNPEKAALLREAWRVLRPGGRLVAAEITLTAPLPAGEGHSLDDWFRWIGGAEPEGDLLAAVTAAGFTHVCVLDRFRNARTGAAQSIVTLFRANKPSAAQDWG